MIEPGCWIDTPYWGPAVCIAVENDWVGFRYRSTRCSDGKTIWVANGTARDKVTFLRPKTTYTARILKLSGPYGEG